MRCKISVWAFLIAVFLAVATAVAVLPACSDTSPPGDGGGTEPVT